MNPKLVSTSMRSGSTHDEFEELQILTLRCSFLSHSSPIYQESGNGPVPIPSTLLTGDSFELASALEFKGRPIVQDNTPL